VHRLLSRQLKRYLGSDTDIPEELQRFVQAIDAAYTQADDDRELIERSLKMTSQELLERNQQLQIRHQELEQMVSERTAVLEKRTIQLQTAAEVARDVTSTRNLDDLLNRTVHLLQERFDFYHTAIYLVDDRGQNAILRTASGKSSQEMLPPNFMLPIYEGNLVGNAVLSNKAQVLENISRGTYQLPLLPNTRSELALPMRGIENIIGVINVHSQEKSAFGENIVSMMQILTDQLAIAISNTQLLQEMGQTLSELETATGQYTKEIWKKVGQRTNSPIGYRYRGLGIEPIIASQIGEQEAASHPAEPGESKLLSVPIKMRDKVIGTLRLQIEEEETLPETTILAESVAERMALALENARLLEESQRRAEQEQLVTWLTARIRETLDVDLVLKRAADGIRQALGLHDVLIQLEEPQLSQSESAEIPDRKADST
jgi:GAF domain-containing protein